MRIVAIAVLLSALGRVDAATRAWRFVPDPGDPSVLVGEGPAMRVSLRPGEVSILPRHGKELCLSFVGARPSASVEGAGRGGGHAEARCRGLYPGVDLELHARRGELEYDLVVAAGTPRSVVGGIAIDIVGARRVSLQDGDAVLEGEAGVLRMRRPVAFQGSRDVPVRYVLRGHATIAFHVGAYDPSLPLVIDPVLGYSSYLGGSGDDEAHGIAVDASGCIYVAGETASPDFPVANALQGSLRGGKDAFVTKLDPTGQTLLWSTYLGGSSYDAAGALALDSTGFPYVAGTTYSADFPVLAALQGTLAGASDAFVCKLDPAGTTLVFSTYLGGSAGDYAYGLAVSSIDRAHVVGGTYSSDFPVASALDPTFDGPTDGFLVKLDASGTALVSSTYLGGPGYDGVDAIALDGARNIYVTGSFYSSGPNWGRVLKLDNGMTSLLWETTLSYREAPFAIAVDPARSTYVSGKYCPYGVCGGFLTKLDASGTRLWDVDDMPEGEGEGIAVDASGRPHVAGGMSDNLAVCSVQGPALFDNAFAMRWNPAGTLIDYGTGLGGSEWDGARVIALGAGGAAWVAGWTRSTDFPIVNARQATKAGAQDAFVARLDPTTVHLPVADFEAYRTSGPVPLTVDFINRSVCDVQSSLWDFGDGSTSMAESPSHTYTQGGSYDVSLTVTNPIGFDTLTRYAYVVAIEPVVANFAGAPTSGQIPLAVTYTNLTTGTASSYQWSLGDGFTSTAASPVHTYTLDGRFTVTLTASGAGGTDTETKVAYIDAWEVLPDFDGSPRIGVAPLSVAFFDRSLGNVQAWRWDFGDGGTSTVPSPTHTYAAPGRYAVSLTAIGASSGRTLTKPDFILVGSQPPADVVTAPGPDPAAPPRILGFDALGRPNNATDILAYGAGGYGAQVSSAELDGAATAEILTGPGPGAIYGPQVRAFSRASAPLPKVNFYAYGTLRYGVIPGAAAVDGDAFDEILTAPGPGPVFGPHVRGFDYDATAVVPLAGLSFYAYGTLKYGANVAAGDIAGAGTEEILTGPGPGPTFGPVVRAFRHGPPIVPLAKVAFSAFPSPGYGVAVEGAAVEGDAFDEIVAGRGPGLSLPTEVRGFDYDDTAVAPIAGLAFTAYSGAMCGAAPRGGDIDGDRRAELLVPRGPDPAAPADVRAFDYAGAVLPIVSFAITPYGTSYGARVAGLPFVP